MTLTATARAYVTPATVVVNVNAPMPAGAIHVDIPSFRGAGRDRYPIVLLQAMGASGLFEPRDNALRDVSRVLANPE